MKHKIVSSVSIVVLLAGVMGAFAPKAFGGDQAVKLIKTFSGDVLLEIVGGVNNPSPTSSNQFGYLSEIKGVSPIFNPGPQDETTALFTFFTEATTTRVINNGALRIVSREGTTTLYTNNASPLDFTNPDSFRSGTPIQTSTLKQQVILDTVEGTFTVVNVNTITSATPFTAGSNQYQLGLVGRTFRTSISGRTNPTPPPMFRIAGYAVGIFPPR